MLRFFVELYRASFVRFIASFLQSPSRAPTPELAGIRRLFACSVASLERMLVSPGRNCQGCNGQVTSKIALAMYLVCFRKGTSFRRSNAELCQEALRSVTSAERLITVDMRLGIPHRVTYCVAIR